MIKLKATKEIEIEIKDNETCMSSCIFWVERCDDMCSLYELKSIDGAKRLQECKDEFGIIDKDGYICGDGWKRSEGGDGYIMSNGSVFAGLTFDGQ